MNISTNSIKSRTKRTWSNSRYIDNHYDSKLHSTPFLPCGLNDSKQIVYSDIGLSEVRTNCTKLKHFKDLEQKNISIKDLINKQGNWRPFLEFQEKQDDIIVTIEYCTNCKDHQKSTRHNEEQYLQNALLIKQCILLNYPEIKVYLKPLVYENDKQITSMFLQRRIGAFEIQLQMHGHQTSIFSKLQSKTWPDVRDVLKQIHSQFKKTNLLIQLTHSDGDENLKSICVTLQSLQTKTQASSQHLRPQSRLSENRSNKSTSIHRQRALSQQTNVQRYTEKSDQQGRVFFMNIPIDRYEIIIPETLNNQPYNDIISLQELVRTDGAFLSVTLKKPTVAVLTVEIVGPQENTDILIPFSDTAVFVIQNQERMLLKEVQGRSGIYEGFIEPGKYTIMAHRYGYEQVQQNIEVKGGHSRIKLQILNKTTDCSTLFNQQTNQSLLNSSYMSKKKKIIKPPQPVNLKVLSLLEVGQIYIVDYFTEQPIAGAKIKIIDSILNKLITCTTHAKGNAKLLFNYLNKGSITVEHQDYYIFDQNYGISEQIDLKSSRTILKLIKRTQKLAIITDYNFDIHSEGNKLDKVQNDQQQCYFEVSTQQKAQLIYVIVEDSKQSQQQLKILEPHEYTEFTRPQINLTVFPQFWLLGIYNETFEPLNQIINHQQFSNYWNETQKHKKPIIKAFYQDCYLLDSMIQYRQSIIPITKEVMDVIINPDDTLLIFYSNSVLKDGEEQIIVEDQIDKVLVIFKDIYIICKENTYIYDQNLKIKDKVKLNSYHIQSIESNLIISVGLQFITLYNVQSTPLNVTFQMKKQCRVHGIVNDSVDWIEKQWVLFGRNDGVISIYDYSLQEVNHVRISLEGIKQIQTNYEELLVVGFESLFRIVLNQESKLEIMNRICLQEEILFFYTFEEQLKLLTPTQTLTYLSFQQRQYLNDSQQARLLISGCPNSRPICYYKSILSYLSQFKQQSIMKLENEQWIVDLLDENVRIGLVVKGSGLQIQIKLQNKYSKIDLGQFKIKRSKGIWIYGVLTYDGDSHSVHEIENRCVDDNLQFEINLPIECPVLNCGDDGLIVSHQQEVKVIDTKQLTTQWCYKVDQVSMIRQQDQYLLIGFMNGKVHILMKESQYTYYKMNEIQINDKQILDIMIIENSLLISSEDRKFIMVAMLDFKVEFQEIVDKSLINNIISYQKGQIVTGYIDGRVRVWKREKSGQQYTLSQVRTIQSMKQISKIIKVPWETHNILIGGEQLILWNLETNKLVRQFKTQSKVLSICCIWNTMIVSGSIDGQVIRWNYGTGEMINVMLFDEPIRNLGIMREYLVTHCTNKIHLQ